jgi:hypothetical protein
VRSSLVELVLLAAGAAVVLFLVLHRNGASQSQVVRASWARTPGVLNPAVTQATIRSTICVRGWTSTVRPPVSYTNHLKEVQLEQYGLHGALSAFQEDHLVSLELGGNPTDARNLWPEPYPRAAQVAEAQRKESALKHKDG